MANIPYPNNFDDDFMNIFKEVITMMNKMGYTYEESLQKAQDILEEARQTNDMNESVQQQINTLIAESGTSDAETLQARVDFMGRPHDVLKDRLDNTDNRVSDIAVSVNDFGTVGDGETDDTINIQNAINHVGERGGGTVLFTYGKKYRTTDTVKVEHNNVNLVGIGAIIEYDNLTGTALKLGKDDGNTRRLGYADLRVVKKDKSWENDAVGIEATSIVWSDLSNIEVEGFKTGLLINSVSGGNAYNQFTLRRVFDNERNLSIDPKGNGWVNENSFYGGNFSISSSRTLSEREKAINLYISDGEGPLVNNNRFYSPCFEGDGVKAIECHAVYQVFYSPRFEGSVKVDLIGDNNTIFHGRGLRRSNVNLSPRSQIINGEGYKVRSSTFTEDEATFDARNDASATYPTYIGRNPLGEEVFKVDGNGNVTANRINVNHHTKEDREFKEANVEHLRMYNYSSTIIGGGGRTIKWGITPPNEANNVGSDLVGSIYICTGGGPVLWVKESAGENSWKALT